MLADLLANNPALEAAVNANPFRNGLYRASSSFVVPLSFADFEILVAPIGLFFALHRKSLYERALGWIVVFGGAIGIFLSGSRGGYVGFLTSIAVFVAIWTVRKALQNRTSLAPAIVGLAGIIGFCVIIVLIFTWRRAHNLVLGGDSEAAASTQARFDQLNAAIPFIKSNPFTGIGFGNGGVAIDSSVDSYFLSVVLETGFPALVFFIGMILLPIWFGLRNYFRDLSQRGAIAGAIACSFIAFTVYRLTLSQKENHMLLFSLLAMIVVLKCDYDKKQATLRSNNKQSHKQQRKPYFPADGPGLRPV